MNKLVGLSLLLITAACGSQLVDFPVDNGDAGTDSGIIDGNIVDAGDAVSPPSDDASDVNVVSDDSATDDSSSNDSAVVGDGAASDDGSVADDVSSDTGSSQDGGVVVGDADAGAADSGHHSDGGVCHHQSCTDDHVQCVTVCAKVSSCKANEDKCDYLCDCDRVKCDTECGDTDCE